MVSGLTTSTYVREENTKVRSLSLAEAGTGFCGLNTKQNFFVLPMSLDRQMRDEQNEQLLLLFLSLSPLGVSARAALPLSGKCSVRPWRTNSWITVSGRESIPELSDTLQANH